MSTPFPTDDVPEKAAAGSARVALGALWRAAALAPEALGCIDLPGDAGGSPLASSFNVATAAQASVAAAALAGAEIWHRRSAGRRQRVAVDRRHATLECCGHFTLDGRPPNVGDKLSGPYACGTATSSPGWVRIHANFAHHRDGALALLGCPPGAATDRATVAAALRHWRAEDVESAAADAGLVVAAARDFATWDRHPQGLALAGAVPVAVGRIPEAPGADPLPWPALAVSAPPLQGLRVLDLTRILAGPVAGRTLAAYGAEVMLVNSPSLPNIEAIADTSRGKLSAHVDLETAAGRDTLRALVGKAHVFLQAYRPGALDALGFGPSALAALRPGIVCVSLSAYGASGPWARRRGFDSLVQTATGFNLAEAQAFGRSEPMAMPMQILDYAAGHLLAFGTQVALLRQAQNGGSWHVQVSLAAVGGWLRSLGRTPPVAALPDGTAAGDETRLFDPFLEVSESGFGRLVALGHAAQFSKTPARWRRASMPPGSHSPSWPVG